MSVPNILSMVYLIYLFFGLFSPNILFVITLPFAFGYSILYMFIQFAFNIPEVMSFFDRGSTVIMIKVGVSSIAYDSIAIFGHLLLSLLMAISIRVRIVYKPVPPTAEQPATSAPTVEQQATSESAQPKQSKWVRALTTARDITVNFFVRYSYYLSLLVLYFADLTTPNADALHAIYLLFFLVYFIFPILAQKAWIVLVIYCQFVVVTLFFYNVYYKSIVGEEYTTIGFTRFNNDSFWEGLAWHFVVLFIVTLQFHVQRLNEVGSIHIDRDKGLAATFPLIKKIVQRIKVLWKYFGIFFCYLSIVLLVILDSRSTVFGLGYILLLFPFVAIHVVFARYYRVLFICWYSIVLYNGIVFFAVYFYQFPLLSRLFDGAVTLIDPPQRRKL
jgi:hypothetical protein